jgi:integrase
MRAGEALGLKWEDIDFERHCVHIRRSAWQGQTQSTKTKGSAAPITLPAVLATVLESYRQEWKPNPEGFLFVTPERSTTVVK